MEYIEKVKKGTQFLSYIKIFPVMNKKTLQMCTQLSATEAHKPTRKKNKCQKETEHQQHITRRTEDLNERKIAEEKAKQ